MHAYVQYKPTHPTCLYLSPSLIAFVPRGRIVGRERRQESGEGMVQSTDVKCMALSPSLSLSLQHNNDMHTLTAREGKKDVLGETCFNLQRSIKLYEQIL